MINFINRRFVTTLIYVLVLLLIVYDINISVENWQWISVWQYRSYLLDGFLKTILISFEALLLSLLLGVLFYILEKSSLNIFRLLVQTFVLIIQGTPLIVYILIGYYIVAHSFGLENKILSGILILASFYGVSMMQIFKSGIDSIHHSQWLAAKSLGLTPFKIYLYVIIPQLWIRILPTLSYQVASLIKDSALLSIISIQEFYQVITNSSNQTYATLDFYLVMAIGYFILTIPFKLLGEWLKKRYSYEI